jgi:hypothetical protein
MFVLVPGACHGGWWYEPSSRGWTVHDLPLTHNVLAGGPDAMLAVLLPLA